MDMKKAWLVAMALVMMGGLAGCGTQFGQDVDRRAQGYTLVGGWLGPVGTVAAMGAAGVVTAVDAITPDSAPAPDKMGEEAVEETTPKPGTI